MGGEAGDGSVRGTVDGGAGRSQPKLDARYGGAGGWPVVPGHSAVDERRSTPCVVERRSTPCVMERWPGICACRLGGTVGFGVDVCVVVGVDVDVDLDVDVGVGGGVDVDVGDGGVVLR